MKKGSYKLINIILTLQQELMLLSPSHTHTLLPNSHVFCFYPTCTPFIHLNREVKGERITVLFLKAQHYPRNTIFPLPKVHCILHPTALLLAHSGAGVQVKKHSIFSRLPNRNSNSWTQQRIENWKRLPIFIVY